MNNHRVLILGNDGYIGWPLSLHLLKLGYTVTGIDNYSRRKRVEFIGSNSLTEIDCRMDRDTTLKLSKNYEKLCGNFNLSDSENFINSFVKEYKPNTIIHLAEMPSAPWSMNNVYNSTITQQENVIGTLRLLWAIREECPDAHLIKLGTMGEYGKPDCDIPEGEIPEKCIGGIDYMLNGMSGTSKVKCPLGGLPFPKSPNSFYHLTKVHDTNNIIFACKTWGLTSTDIMQGVVYGLMDTDKHSITRFDYDEYFGTCINRFCAQAIIGHPLTVYGAGTQSYSFLPLKDSIQCITLAIENPPKKGDYRVLNQFESVYSINDLAKIVTKSAKKLGINLKTNHITNPRSEPENHYYNPIHQRLYDLGYKPTKDIQNEVDNLLSILIKYKDRIIEKVILPKTNWR